MTEEEIYIARCIQLAKSGSCNVSPNPMVGAVIVCDGKIIGEGYHVCYGCAHAEVNAIKSVKDKSLLVRSTIYVSLEPCSHHGKTPPCADLIIEKRIPRVVIGCVDPHSKVAGRGIQKLRSAGVEVKVGVLEEMCKNLIRQFITFNTLRRPYIILKWAQSCDGFMDIERIEGWPVILSNPMSGMLVHKKRAEVDAIMVGRRTALLDNPSLTVRNWSGNNPLRVVLDKNLSLPTFLHLFDGRVKTLVFTEKKEVSENNVEYIQVNFDESLLSRVMHVLYQKKIQSLLVEGGRILLQSFIDAQLWDEACTETTILKLGNGVKAPLINRYTECSQEDIFGSSICHWVR